MNRIQHQRGSALLVSMILLFVISIMGVSVMQSSTLEHRMATNSIEAKAVFQSAESATEAALNDDGNITDAFNAGVGNTVSIDVDLKQGQSTAITSSAELTFLGSTLAQGSSIGIFEGLRFEAVGTGTRGGNSNKSVTQGALRVVPAN